MFLYSQYKMYTLAILQYFSILNLKIMCLFLLLAPVSSDYPPCNYPVAPCGSWLPYVMTQLYNVDSGL